MFPHSYVSKVTWGLVKMQPLREPHDMHTVQPQPVDSDGDSACEEQPSRRVLRLVSVESQMRLYSGRDWFTDGVLQPSSTQVGHTDTRSVTASNNRQVTMTSCKPIRVTTTCAIHTAGLSATNV
jgi:hypothetical protein